MSNMKKILSLVLVTVLLMGTMLTGCSMPKLMLGGTPDIAATIDGQEFTTGEYLAYLYNSFYNMYYNQGLYQYEQYGMDIWTQTFSYGEGDDAEELALADYIIASTKDSMVRQVALTKMLKEYGIEWDKEKEKELNTQVEGMGEDAYLSLGISNENFIAATKALSLNETSLFYGLYGEGGQKEMSEKDRKEYFEKNYVSYKMISASLMTEEGEEMSKTEQETVVKEMEKYLELYNKDKNFEKVVDRFNKDTAEDKDAKIEASKDEDNRVNLDTTNASDENLVKAVKEIAVGSAKVVTYENSSGSKVAALILRLDINAPADVFTDETDNIIYGAKYEAFDKEVKKAVEELEFSFDNSVVKTCKPENFVSAD